MFLHRSYKLAFTFMIAASLAGCLKSRYNLRNDRDSQQEVSVKPTAVKAQEPSVLDDIRAELQSLSQTTQELKIKLATENDRLTAKDQEIQALREKIEQLEAAHAELVDSLKKPVVEAVDPSSIYEEGFDAFRKKNYEVAIEKFAAYLKTPKPKRQEEAYFFKAESLFQTKQYRKAIVDFSTIQEKFPKSKRVPTVLYQIGVSFEKMGLKSDGKAFFQELVDKYPRSTEAKKALLKLR